MFNKLERMIIWGSILGCLLATMIVHAQETTVGPPASAAPALKPDPSGANTGGAADVVGTTAGAPTAEEMKKWATNEPLAMKLADVVGHNRIAINIDHRESCQNREDWGRKDLSISSRRGDSNPNR